MTHGRKRPRRHWLLPLLAVAGLAVSGLPGPLPWQGFAAFQPSSPAPGHPLRTWVNYFQEQSIEMEFRQFPGNVFKIAIPEVVSDAEGVIVPWEQDSPSWEFSREMARWSTTIPNVVYMEAEVEFKGSELETRVKLRNLSKRTWRNTNAFICLTYADAPLFNDPQLERTFVPTADWRSPAGWVPLAKLFAAYDHGRGNYTFFPVSGGPGLMDLWVFQRVNRAAHRQVLSRGFGGVVSKDGKWTIGMTTANAAYFFNNRSPRVEHQDGVCIHADPLLGDVSPGGYAEGVSTIHIVEGGLDALIARCIERYGN